MMELIGVSTSDSIRRQKDKISGDVVASGDELSNTSQSESGAFLPSGRRPVVVSPGAFLPSGRRPVVVSPGAFLPSGRRPVVVSPGAFLPSGRRPVVVSPVVNTVPPNSLPFRPLTPPSSSPLTLTRVAIPAQLKYLKEQVQSLEAERDTLVTQLYQRSRLIEKQTKTIGLLRQENAQAKSRDAVLEELEEKKVDIEEQLRVEKGRVELLTGQVKDLRDKLVSAQLCAQKASILAGQLASLRKEKLSLTVKVEELEERNRSMEVDALEGRKAKLLNSKLAAEMQQMTAHQISSHAASLKKSAKRSASLRNANKKLKRTESKLKGNEASRRANYRITFSLVGKDQAHLRLKELDRVVHRIVGPVSSESLNDEISSVLHTYVRKRGLVLADVSKLTALQDLALSLEAGFTQNQRAKVKTFFLQRNIDVFASTYSVRALRKEVVDLHKYSFSDVKTMKGKKGEKSGSVIELSNVAEVAAFRLRNLIESGQLVPTVDSADGSSTVRVCIVGDKGKNTTKVSLLVGGVSKANDVHNMLLLAMYEGEDNGETLRGMIGGVVDQINALKRVQVDLADGKSFDLKLEKFVTGDFMYLYACLGLKGPNATNNCPFCTRPRDCMMSTDEPAYPLRTLEEMKKWSKTGSMGVEKGILPLFDDIELDHYLPGSLHTTCGAAIKFGITPLRTAALNEDLKLSGCKVQLDETDVNDVDDNGQMNDLNKNGKRKGSDTEKEATKRLAAVKAQLQECENALKKGDEAKADANLMLDALDAIDSKQIIPSGHPSCRSSVCMARHVSFNDLSAVAVTSIQCDTCRQWYHMCCEGYFTDEDLIQLEEDDCICLRCASNAPDELGSMMNKIRKSLSEINDHWAKRENERAELVEEHRKINMVIRDKMGPTQQSLDKKFKEVGADLRSFGQCLTGGHIAKCLSRGAPDILWSVIPPSQKVTVFKEMMGHLRAIQKGAVSREMTNDEKAEYLKEIQYLEQKGKDVMPNASRTPKAHSLFRHVPELLAKYNSCAFFSDHPSEKIHIFFEQKGKQYACIRNKEKRWRALVNDLAIANFVHDCRE